ncbi:hypothetical protein L3Q82_017914 [Scortum barcoo]|uniref:Uncharacterized protein n=1 Tax=Scortum barcoo TaxID=214431 RepID=A0ACB8VIY1_9TELE|nr:hypothetical protein L3Q82_017914 [Scortum barcoo]
MSDHISVNLIPAYKPLICRTRPTTRTVQVWTEEASSALQDCFECTDWEVFKEGTDLDGYTSSVLSYLKFCTDAVLPTKTIKVFPNQKPWLDSTVKPLLKACDAAYRSGDKLAYSIARKELKKGIKLAKSRYKRCIEEHFENNARFEHFENNARFDTPGSREECSPSPAGRTASASSPAAAPNIIPAGLDQYQFAHSTGRTGRQRMQSPLHLQLPNTYVRMLFVDFSSAFNTVIPDKLILKLHNLGLPSSLCHLDQGLPHQQAFRCDCSAIHSTNTIVKFADDTTIVGLISDNDETHYREEIQHLTQWCSNNNLVLNTSKTKEVIVDYRRYSSPYWPELYSNSAALKLSSKCWYGYKKPLSACTGEHPGKTDIDTVKSYKYLGVHLNDSLDWSDNTNALVKKGNSRLFLLRRLRSFGVQGPLLRTFYDSVVASAIFYSI